MGVSDEAKNVIPLKFLSKIKNKNVLLLVNINPGTYCIHTAQLLSHLPKTKDDIQGVSAKTFEPNISVIC
jgi:hypothetical protein